MKIAPKGFARRRPAFQRLLGLVAAAAALLAAAAARAETEADDPPLPATRPSTVQPAPEAAPATAPNQPTRRYRVINQVSDGVLNMRSGPGTGYPLIVAMPAGAGGLTLGRCRMPDQGGRAPWCEVRWQGHSGWASMCCIVEASAPAAGQSYRIAPDVSDGVLNMRRGPGTRHPLVVGMPAGSGDVTVGACRMPDDGGRLPWCEVRWRGHSGWASSCCMLDARTGQRPRLGQ